MSTPGALRPLFTHDRSCTGDFECPKQWALSHMLLSLPRPATPRPTHPGPFSPPRNNYHLPRPQYFPIPQPSEACLVVVYQSLEITVSIRMSDWKFRKDFASFQHSLQIRFVSFRKLTHRGWLREFYGSNIKRVTCIIWPVEKIADRCLTAACYNRNDRGPREQS